MFLSPAKADIIDQLSGGRKSARHFALHSATVSPPLNILPKMALAVRECD